MIVVVDASAGFELLTNSIIGAKIRKHLEDAELVLAPDIYWAEVANVCWRAVQRKEMTLDDACRGLRVSIGLVDTIISSSGLLPEALTQACATAHPVYDLLYLTLARREAAVLISLDKELKRLAKKNGVTVAFN